MYGKLGARHASQKLCAYDNRVLTLKDTFELVVVEQIHHCLTKVVVGEHEESPLQRMRRTHQSDGRDAEDVDNKKRGQASDHIEDGHTDEGR